MNPAYTGCERQFCFIDSLASVFTLPLDQFTGKSLTLEAIVKQANSAVFPQNEKVNSSTD